MALAPLQLTGPVRHKRSIVPGRAPQPTDLEVAQIAVNLRDRSLFTKDDLGNVVQLLAPPSTANSHYASRVDLQGTQEPERGSGRLWTAGPYMYLEAATAATDHHLTTASGVKLYAVGNMLTQDQAPGADIARIAYDRKAMLIVKSGETIVLACDPSAGDDLQSMAAWASGRHWIGQGGELIVRVADGLHDDPCPFIDVTDNRRLDIRASAFPDLIQITAIALANAGEIGGLAGEVYTATLTLAAPLPARVVPNYALGCSNIQGDNGAAALNGGIIVETISGDRLTVTGKFRSHGVAATSPTALNNTTTLSLLANRLVVPFACLRVRAQLDAENPGNVWDGSKREGFLNALRGGKIDVWYLGIAYNGVTSEHDIAYAHGAGGCINFRDNCVVVGAGDKVLRAAAGGRISGNRSCFSGGITGAEIFQGISGGHPDLTRCSMGSVSGPIVTATACVNAMLTQCILASGNQALRSTYPDSAINCANSRISHCNQGAAPTNGRILVDSLSSIKSCTTPISITGSNGGTVHGNPTIADCTNAAPTPYLQDSGSGGVWFPTPGPMIAPGVRLIGKFPAALDFPSIPAHSFATLTMAAVGALPGDHCRVPKRNAAQNVEYEAFCSAADVLTVWAVNRSTAAIDPTAFTAQVVVERA
jgi:hypothetical protein